jgi:hypothetical protein
MPSQIWHYLEILQQFIDVCRDKTATNIATVLAQAYLSKLHSETTSLLDVAA